MISHAAGAPPNKEKRGDKKNKTETPLSRGIKTLKRESLEDLRDVGLQVAVLPDFIIGVDEAGYGCLAGSCFVAAVCFARGATLDALHIQDSKKLKAEAREKSSEGIRGCAAVAVESFTSEEIDERKLNVHELRFRSAKRAVQKLLKDIDCKSSSVLVVMDGNHEIDITEPNVTSIAVIKGDSKLASVAAASIIAKTQKDSEMSKLDNDYPMYGFANHQGYGTKKHYENISKYGLCKEHRKFYIKKEVRDDTRERDSDQLEIS